MAINPAAASATYLNNARAATGNAAGLTDETPARVPGQSFLDLVKDSVGTTVQANRAAEQISAEAIAGRADLTDVVTALSHAETTLTTVVKVRDRMISAYQQVLRMPI